MSRAKPTDAERAMTANAKSRVQQGAEGDKATRKREESKRRPTDTPAARGLKGRGGAPAQGKP